MISTLTNRGKVPWKAFAGAMNADILIDFMKRLVKKAIITAQAPSRAKGDLKKATVSHLRRLLNSPQRIMRYFQHPKLHDAA
ncbi:hypothetical protein GWK36_07715 [Caldichromatium japonicum]|uniref:Uncharacterized protein n=1 Tax=Caldichromatium japonicum TaxID=2699430 RepID=A0A6G7VCZ4_9GAMM|nr:hypothetical protein [Caldichromatium japonicum]QIK37891.1 hypothetical protein GWK36_07715 [Caldichromatium japonicum]